ncbi:hypothetical protein [Chromobacterium vaccinii]|uniref:hypothetical protein n=1 Tax=Chromobacterium vaccinii TaxID=1108595 RepID=UPI0031D740A2
MPDTHSPIDGVSSLCPALSHRFLSLQEAGCHPQPLARESVRLQALLSGFDDIAFCRPQALPQLAQRIRGQHAQSVVSTLESACLHWEAKEHRLARTQFGNHLRRHPADVVALFCTHIFDCCLGQPHALREDLARCARHIEASHSLYPYYLSIHAYVLADADQAEQALPLALAALRQRQDNLYGIYAAMRALQALGCRQESALFLAQSRRLWAERPQLHARMLRMLTSADASFDRANAGLA